MNDIGNFKNEIASKVAYLLGVKDYFLNTNFNKKTIEEIENHKDAKIIRNLSLIRMSYMANYKEIKVRQQSLTPITEMTDIMPIEIINYLDSVGLTVVFPNTEVSAHIAYINQYIASNIDKVKNLFPLWVEWNYIKSLFIMKSSAMLIGSFNKNKDMANKVRTNIYNERKKHAMHKEFYPFGIWWSWDEDRIKDYYGNILLNDNKFLSILYASHDDSFRCSEYVIGADEEVKNNIYNFLDSVYNPVFLVDCENTDPYKLCALLKGIDEEEIGKIKKLVLYDDINSPEAWNFFENIIDIPIEHILCERVLENKSLVDMYMIAGACKNYYEEQADGICIVSSDSDFFALVKALPNIKFFVLNEENKTSSTIIEHLDEYNISHCYMEEFSLDLADELKNDVLLGQLNTMVEEFNTTGELEFLNLTQMVDTIFSRAFIKGDFKSIQKQKNTFYNRYVKTLKTKIYDEVVEDEVHHKIRLELNIK